MSTSKTNVNDASPMEHSLQQAQRQLDDYAAAVMQSGPGRQANAALTVSESATATTSRRAFLATSAAAGSFVLMLNSQSSDAAQVQDSAVATENSFNPDLFVSIAPDGTVSILTHRSEMGTGIRTTLPRIVADELEANWDDVNVVQAIGDKRLGDQNTDGSNSIRFFFDRMRVAGATTRTMLQQAAAKKWGVPVNQCIAKENHIVDQKSGQKIGYGELVEIAKTLPIPKAETLKFKPKSQWQYIGKDAPIIDQDAIVTGKAIYGIDARMPNQLYAVVARPPVVGGVVKSVDDQDALETPGVEQVLQIPKFKGAPLFQPLGGVAVLAKSTWAAIQGRDALDIEWELGENADYNTDAFAKTLAEAAHKPGKVMRKMGDAPAVIEKAGTDESNRVLHADYSSPHLSHAPMEPPCAVADVRTENGKIVHCLIDTATQNPQAVQQAVSAALSIPPQEVIVNVTLLGSAFGRKSKPDYCVEAALLSLQTQRPVHVTFTREDDLQSDYFHTISHLHLQAAVDENGAPEALLARAAYPTIGSTFVAGADEPQAWEMEMGLTDIPYNIPNLQIEGCKAKSHTRIGWLRSVAHIQQNFALGSFMDELAHRAGIDPYEYLLATLGPDRQIDMKAAGLGNRGASHERYPYDIGRLKNVVKRAADLSDWKRAAELPKGRGMGIACCRSFLGYTGHVVEVEVSREGKLTIHKVWVSLDAGLIVNPDRVKAQIEGGTVMATTQARYGKISFKKGRSVESNYDSYRMVTMSDCPREIIADVVESDEAPAGVGETPVPSFAPALCNAIFAATGHRVRDLPLSEFDLSWS
jgi:isoquinoline 1-oxidoreductase beta subunit